MMTTTTMQHGGMASGSARPAASWRAAGSAHAGRGTTGVGVSVPEFATLASTYELDGTTVTIRPTDTTVNPCTKRHTRHLGSRST